MKKKSECNYNPADSLWLCIEDAIYAIKYGDSFEALEALETAKGDIEPFISLFYRSHLPSRVRDEIWEQLGVNIPKDYTLAQAITIIKELEHEVI